MHEWTDSIHLIRPSDPGIFPPLQVETDRSGGSKDQRGAAIIGRRDVNVLCVCVRGVSQAKRARQAVRKRAAAGHGCGELTIDRRLQFSPIYNK
jgi:hypothetical protein